MKEALSFSFGNGEPFSSQITARDVSQFLFFANVTKYGVIFSALRFSKRRYLETSAFIFLSSKEFSWRSFSLIDNLFAS